MTWITDSLQSFYGKGWLTSAYNGNGVLGALVPSSGVDGPAFGYADLTLPDDADAEVRWRMLRWPSAGTLTPNEDSSFTFSGAGPGRYFFDVECYINGRSKGVKRVFLLLGAQPTLVEQLHTALAPLATGSAWYATNEADPSGQRFPFITVQRVGATPNVGLTGPSDLQNTRVQVDIHARTIAECVTLETQVQAMMAEWALVNVPLSRLDLYEDVTRTFRVILDYSIWSFN